MIKLEMKIEGKAWSLKVFHVSVPGNEESGESPVQRSLKMYGVRTGVGAPSWCVSALWRDAKSSHDKGKTFPFFLFWGIYMRLWMLTKHIDHFTICVSQIIMLYTLNLYSIVCQLHLNEMAKKYKKKFDGLFLPIIHPQKQGNTLFQALFPFISFTQHFRKPNIWIHCSLNADFLTLQRWAIVGKSWQPQRQHHNPPPPGREAQPSPWLLQDLPDLLAWESVLRLLPGFLGPHRSYL